MVFQDNPRSTAIKAVAKANDVDLKIEIVDTANPTPELLKANPLGKIPAFQGEDGFALAESIAIAIYSTFAPAEAECCFFACSLPTVLPSSPSPPIWRTQALAYDDLALYYTVIPV